MVALLGPLTGPPAAFAEGSPAVLFVLDSSGSMNAVDGHGVRLIDGAKAAISKVSGELPDGAAMGLRVYGSDYAGTDKSIGCRDTRLVLPVAPTDPTALKAALGGFHAVGETPIGYTLQQTAGDFSSDGADRIVVLVSDGQDNCSAPDSGPCVVAKQLANQHIKLRIETVGLNLAKEPVARSQLQCIASATGGHYYDAKDTATLAQRLNQIAARVIKDFSLGRIVDGGVGPNEAPVLTPGTYRDAMVPGQTKWYAFDVRSGVIPQAIAGVRGSSTSTASPPPGGCQAWEASLLSRALEGGEYAPYYNSSSFDGVTNGYTAVRSIAPTSEDTGGLDFPGRWYVRLQLADKTLTTCSKNLPKQRFQVQLTFQTLAPGDDGATPQAQPTGDTGVEVAPTAEAAPSTPAVEKYFENPPPGTPGWVYPLVAVLVVGLAGSGFAGYRLYKRAHYL